MKDNSKDRSIHYSILSRFLTDQLHNEDLKKVIDFSEHIIEYGREMILELKETMKEWSENKENEALRAEYARIFLLPQGVKAYESVYRSSEKLLKQEPWEKVKKFYLKYGLELDEDMLHPEDHASVELAFMALLIDNKASFDIQKAFYKEHISRWLPDLFEDIQSNSNGDFYKKVASYGKAFMKEESKRFEGK